ncbi:MULTISPECIES: hypothetical protein [Acinetobacter]
MPSLRSCFRYSTITSEGCFYERGW